MGDLEMQTEVWVEIAAAGGISMAVAEIRAECRALREHLAAEQSGRPAGTGSVPVVLVPRDLDAERLVTRLRSADGSDGGVLDPNHGPEGLAPYAPIPGLGLPDRPFYALVEVARGDAFRGVAPRDALAELSRRGRTPLTIEEGVALVLLYPGLLATGHGFSLAGSRRGDKRVPALWISRRAPKLGWCWEGNPHDWLGLASTASRLG